jgi:hypothetical protein
LYVHCYSPNNSIILEAETLVLCALSFPHLHGVISLTWKNVSSTGL